MPVVVLAVTYPGTLTDEAVLVSLDAMVTSFYCTVALMAYKFEILPIPTDDLPNVNFDLTKVGSDGPPCRKVGVEI